MSKLVCAEPTASLSPYLRTNAPQQLRVAQLFGRSSGLSSWGAIALVLLGSLAGIAQSSAVQAETVTASFAAQFGLTPLDLKTKPVSIVPTVPSLPAQPPLPVPAGQSPAVLGQACALPVATRPVRVYTFPTHLDNYGDRLAWDARRQPVPHTPSLIVVHETVGSISSTLHLFKRPPALGRPPVSYHLLIARDGTLIQTVPPEQRALGAANSAFRQETVQLNPKLPGSVNNFAYHISLETPPDGRDNRPFHSGYTDQQYRSLAYWTGRMMQTYGVPWDRITTHKAVDRSGSRQDPRSFNWQRFRQHLTLQVAHACSPNRLQSRVPDRAKPSS
jgi:hypothetical protein